MACLPGSGYWLDYLTGGAPLGLFAFRLGLGFGFWGLLCHFFCWEGWANERLRLLGSGPPQLICHPTVSARDTTWRINGQKALRCTHFVLYSTESPQSKINDKYMTMLYSLSVLHCLWCRPHRGPDDKHTAFFCSMYFVTSMPTQFFYGYIQLSPTFLEPLSFALLICQSPLRLLFLPLNGTSLLQICSSPPPPPPPLFLYL